MGQQFRFVFFLHPLVNGCILVTLLATEDTLRKPNNTPSFLKDLVS
jgi:hypothetical protein